MVSGAWGGKADELVDLRPIRKLVPPFSKWIEDATISTHNDEVIAS